MNTTIKSLANPEYKDRLFKFIFGRDTEESKRWRLQLYNALNGTNVTDPDELKINTIENVIYITMHNDISFLVDSEMKLSDSFLNPDKSGAFEWTATIINLHPNHNSTLNKNCTPLYHYVKFTAKISENIKAGMNKQEAIEKAVNYAIDNNFLEGFFKIHKAEVIGMCLTEFDEEEAKRIWHEDGFSEGVTIGAQQKAVENAVTVIRKYKAKPEDAAADMNAPLEKVLEALKTK